MEELATRRRAHSVSSAVPVVDPPQSKGPVASYRPSFGNTVDSLGIPRRNLGSSKTLGNKTASVLGPLALKKKKNSTLAGLEQCLAKSFQASDSDVTFALPMVKEAIGRISFAVQYEKSGLAKIEEAEEAFSKASAAIATVLQNEEVQKNEECKYWLKLFDFHVNAHLHEIVVLADSQAYNSKKTPVYYDQVEDENLQLKEDIDNLKSVVDELKSELSLYKDGKKNFDPILGETKTEESVDDIYSTLGEDLLEKLKYARIVLQDLKVMDSNIQKNIETNSNLLKNFLIDLDGFSIKIARRRTEEKTASL